MEQILPCTGRGLDPRDFYTSDSSILDKGFDLGQDLYEWADSEVQDNILVRALGLFKVATYFILIFYLMGFYCQIKISNLINRNIWHNLTVKNKYEISGNFEPAYCCMPCMLFLFDFHMSQANWCKTSLVTSGPTVAMFACSVPVLHYVFTNCWAFVFSSRCCLCNHQWFQ